RVRVRNVGERALSPVLQVASNGGPTDQVRVEKLAAGESREVLVSFLPEKSWVGEQAGKGEHWYGEKGTGARFSSDAVKGLVVSSAEAGELLLERIEARLPEPKPLPEWLGKKPPVAGEWVRTLDEDFSGESLDEGIWDVYTENYWDKKSAFSKDNVLLGDGLVRLRYERKESHHNDDPQRKKFPFTTGYLGTYGKFVQLYGYFEARMKMPTTPGLWPAFWMMPDRGPGSKIYRQSTKHQGMEFDIMEHLTRWGPTRFNVAMHWDDYGKEHKAVGSDMIYTRPDAEGYVTCGLLWLPGKAVYYYNGEEVARWEHERISRVPSYLLFTLPQGGWDNAPLDEAQLPGDFTIDYVRVWQRKDFMKKD
ncbi:MAG: glycoside hydrolase family 16 protein, partial [Verrucomicrobiales bacterium]